MSPLKKTCLFAATFLACLSLSACRSAFVQTSIVNHSGGAVTLVEVDYPSASFGTQQIASGDTFNYRFKIQDSGPVKISYADRGNKSYASAGPVLNQGQQGTLTITLEPDGKVVWIPELSTAK
jgi:hypothetical protein